LRTRATAKPARRRGGRWQHKGGTCADSVLTTPAAVLRCDRNVLCLPGWWATAARHRRASGSDRVSGSANTRPARMGSPPKPQGSRCAGGKLAKPKPTPDPSNRKPPTPADAARTSPPSLGGRSGCQRVALCSAVWRCPRPAGDRVFTARTRVRGGKGALVPTGAWRNVRLLLELRRIAPRGLARVLRPGRKRNQPPRPCANGFPRTTPLGPTKVQRCGKIGNPAVVGAVGAASWMGSPRMQRMGPEQRPFSTVGRRPPRRSGRVRRRGRRGGHHRRASPEILSRKRAWPRS
jgi:hypothetical protein